MTPFEKAGYTKDSKFKTLVPYGNLPKGTVVTLHTDDDGSFCPYFKTLCGNPQEYAYRLNELELIVEQEVGVTTYPNPPHKYAELIKQWADGAEIEYYCKQEEGWKKTSNLTWSNNLEYRVKPPKPEKDIQIEKLEADLIVVQKEMGKFYNEFMCYYTKTLEISDRIQELKSNV